MYPTSQGQLIRLARDAKTQTQFAQDLGCDRTCLSRYESETLGAPTAVINQCLRMIATRLEKSEVPVGQLSQALTKARQLVATLEMFDKAEAFESNPRHKNDAH